MEEKAARSEAVMEQVECHPSGSCRPIYEPGPGAGVTAADGWLVSGKRRGHSNDNGRTETSDRPFLLNKGLVQQPSRYSEMILLYYRHVRVQNLQGAAT